MIKFEKMIVKQMSVMDHLEATKLANKCSTWDDAEYFDTHEYAVLARAYLDMKDMRDRWKECAEAWEKVTNDHEKAYLDANPEVKILRDKLQEMQKQNCFHCGGSPFIPGG